MVSASKAVTSTAAAERSLINFICGFCCGQMHITHSFDGSIEQFGHPNKANGHYNKK